jgi:hypothetical protein
MSGNLEFDGDDTEQYIPTEKAKDLWDQIMNHNTALDNTVETMDAAMNVVLQKHEYEYL